MSKRILNVILIITSLFGYLEWGHDSHTFLFEVEGDIFKKLFSKPASVLHPFVVLPLLGQILLLISLFQKQPGKWITFIGIAAIGMLMLMIFFIGISTMNIKMIASATPFTVCSILSIRLHLKNR
ncbi:MAG: hypothetical protein KG003_02765 [Bacteroidetes bacterium]|nr:hypothetical protein [Bacteroidota bacterium]